MDAKTKKTIKALNEVNEKHRKTQKKGSPQVDQFRMFIGMLDHVGKEYGINRTVVMEQGGDLLMFTFDENGQLLFIDSQ